jgi:NAD(P)-dependent dehydrogenase (short-subunit alcohol dehydrogenase family)
VVRSLLPWRPAVTGRHLRDCGGSGLTDTVGSRTINTDAQFDAVAERQALKRRLTPDDTAAALAFLASDGVAALTGQTLVTDGGLVLR